MGRVSSTGPRHPFLLRPHLAERVWGGTRLGEGIGEAWDLSVHPNGESIIASGPHEGSRLASVVADHPDAFGGGVDLLAKRLDCAANLSVQVHPAAGDPKTEAWVVLEAGDGAGVYLGFDGDHDVDEVRRAALDGSLADMLAFVPLSAGDAVFVPAGTVHAIGGGLVLFELQQSSDTTYRLFDWGRTERELHLDDGLACADLTSPPPLPEPRPVTSGVSRLVECGFFAIDRLDGSEPLGIDPHDRWAAMLVTSGSARVGELELTVGDTMCVPSSAGAVVVEPDSGFAALGYGPGGSR